MASLSSDKNGNRTIQFVGGDGKRRSIRLGRVSKKVAESIKLKVESLSIALVAKLPLDGETAAWVAGIGDELAAKLAAVGLIPERHSQSLGAFLDDYLARRRATSKPATVVTIARVATDLTLFLGPDTDLRAVTEVRADAFKGHLIARGLAGPTVSRRLKNARMLFKHAQRLKLIPSNPFAEVSAPGAATDDRDHYVSPEDALALIRTANPVWRTIIALARFGGLRCPSEVLSLRWEEVNFETSRMTVTAPKTEHIPGKAYRVVPLFAILRPYLDEAWELAPTGEEYVVGGKQGAGYRAAANGPKGWVNCNLRETFLKLIRRAGQTPWPKLFQNLRASCETDLMQHHPIHVVTAWMGNTPRIALTHYLQTLERDFEKATQGGAESGAEAVQNPVQPGAAGKGQEGKGETVPSEMVGVRTPLSLSGLSCTHEQMGEAGLEPVGGLPGFIGGSEGCTPPGAAESGAVGEGQGITRLDDLLQLVERMKALTPDQLSLLAQLLQTGPIPTAQGGGPV